MYDLLKNIIAHTWITGTNVPGDQTILYYMSTVVVCVLVVCFVDMVYKLLSAFVRHIKL